ncbi:MAG: DUF1572 family protein [Phycisphaerales bacterium]
MSNDYLAQTVINSFTRAFRAQKHLAESAIRQVPDGKMREALDANTNCLAVIMKHVGGNLRSRFNGFLTEDGEKPWRNRDDEFVDTFDSRKQMLTAWEEGWTELFEVLTTLTPADLERSVTIRGESITVPDALARSLAHTGYHVGQIVQTARVLCKDEWEVITIPKGGSEAFNLKMGFDPRRV